MEAGEVPFVPPAQIFLSIQHLYAAAHFAREAGRIELLRPAVQEADVRVYLYSTLTAIMCAEAFVETSINDFYQAAVEQNRQVFVRTDPGVLRALAAAWPEIERMSSYRKHEIALALMGKEPLPTGGGSAAENVQFLAQLRNALVHYKAEHRDRPGEHRKLEARLRNRFAPSPFMQESMPFIPSHCLSYGAAVWAVRSARTFTEEFAARADASLQLARYEQRLSTEVMRAPPGTEARQ